jgi:hypothetical protein
MDSSERKYRLVPEELYTAIVTYLARRPYAEVAQAMAALSEAKQVDEQHKSHDE